jgi:predicted Fe-S protein YdhL (DUF1289 family)
MTGSMASENAISSPCNRVCVMHPASGICIGCGRSLDEIARWAVLSETERLAIMARLPARLTALKAGNATPAVT